MYEYTVQYNAVDVLNIQYNTVDVLNIQYNTVDVLNALTRNKPFRRIQALSKSMH